MTPLLGGWLCVCGLKREAAIWGGRAVVGGGRSDRLAQTVERAIAQARPRGLVSFGLAGALTADLTVGDVVVGSEVVQDTERWSCDAVATAMLVAALDVRPTVVVGSATVIGNPAAKHALGATGAAVDMESQVAARAAARHGLPLAVLRVVSDAVGHVLPPAAIAGFREDGDIDTVAVIAALARDPRQLPALLQAGRSSGIAFRKLKAVKAALEHAALDRIGSNS